MAKNNVKTKTIEILKVTLGVDPQVTNAMFDSGMLAEHICRRVVIQTEYTEMVGHVEGTKKAVKQMLADKYNISYEAVQKYVYSINLCESN